MQNETTDDVTTKMRKPGGNARLSGYVNKVIFHKKETSFLVMEMYFPALRNRYTVAGSWSGELAPGAKDAMTVEGKWEEHKTHGLQLKAKTIEAPLPSSKDAILRWLRAYKNEGLDEHSIHKLCERFKNRIDKALEEKDMLVACGINNGLAQKISFAWVAMHQTRKLKEILKDYKIKPQQITCIIRQFGKHSCDIVSSNPWKLALEVKGIGFTTAEKIAEACGIPKTSDVRIQAAILHKIQEMCQAGHVALATRKVIEETSRFLKIDERQLDGPLKDIIDSGILVHEVIAGAPVLYLKRSYQSESQIAYSIASTMLVAPSNELPLRAKQFLQQYQEMNSNSVSLNADQLGAALQVFEKRFSILRGGPGTGKTTTIDAIVKAAVAMGKKVHLAAPTAKAAKRMTEITGINATTGHRLLGVREGKWKHNKENPLDGDLIVLDEGSMLDIHLTAGILQAVPENMHVLMIGDIFQLPSVGPGKVLSDIIDSTVVPVKTLSRVYRTKQGSGITEAAYMINDGIVPGSDMGDYKQIAQDDPRVLLKFLEKVVTESFPRKGFSTDDIVVAAPMRKGQLGVRNLNKILSAVLNPKDYISETITSRKGDIYGPGEKIIQIENEYDRGKNGVVNGDTGRILDYDKTTREALVRFDGIDEDFIYSQYDLLKKTEPAWALTIHKMQGSETPAMINFIHSEARFMLKKNLFMTGVTRGKQIALTLGDYAGFEKAVNTIETGLRVSGLSKNIYEKYSYLSGDYVLVPDRPFLSR